MAAFAFGELIALLFFSALIPSDIEPLPAESVMRAIPADCEVVMFQDLRGIDEAVSNIFDTLSRQSWVSGNPDIAEGLSEAHSAFGEMRREATTHLGIDPFNQLHSASFCAKLNEGSPPLPSVLFVIQGNFTADFGGRLAGIMELGEVTLSNGQQVRGGTEDGITFGLTAIDGALAVGTDDYLAPVAASFPAAAIPAAAAGSLVARMAELAPHGMRAFGGVRPSTSSRLLIASEAPASFAQLVAGTDYGLVAYGRDAQLIELRATDAGTFRRYSLVLEGAGQLLQAAPLALSGTVRVMLGVLSADDPDLEDELRTLVAHGDEILAFLGEFGLDQPAEVTFNADATTLTSSLMTAGSVSVQAGAILMGFGVIGFVGRSTSSMPPPPPAYEAPAHY